MQSNAAAVSASTATISRVAAGNSGAAGVAVGLGAAVGAAVVVWVTAGVALGETVGVAVGVEAAVGDDSTYNVCSTSATALTAKFSDSPHLSQKTWLLQL